MVLVVVFTIQKSLQLPFAAREQFANALGMIGVANEVIERFLRPLVVLCLVSFPQTGSW